MATKPAKTAEQRISELLLPGLRVRSFAITSGYGEATMVTAKVFVDADKLDLLADLMAECDITLKQEKTE